MGYHLSPEELEALWCEPEAPQPWESPDVRAQRYENALRGILGCCGDGLAVWMIQAVAASALHEDKLLDHYNALITQALKK